MRSIIILINFFMCTTLLGQPPEKYEYLVPKEPVKKQDKIIDDYDEKDKKSFSEDDKILVDHLNKIFLVSYDSHPVYSKRGNVLFDKNLYVPDKEILNEELNSYIGLPVTMKRLNSITNAVEKFYYKKGYALVVANLKPNQDISDGTVVISVLIARMGNVSAEGAKYFSNKKIAEQIRTKKGKYIYSDLMISDLSWINSHSFYSTNLIYEKGENIGESDVLLKTEDRFPLRPFVGYENTGNQTVGVNRYFLGFNWGKAWGLDSQELNYQFTSANDPKEWISHSGSYQIFLPWRHRLQAFGFYSRTKKEQDYTLYLEGKGWQVSGRYLIPFVRWIIRNQITVGYDFKRTNNFLEFVGNTVFNTYVDISQFVVEYDGQAKDPLGLTIFGFRAVFSPGNMTDSNTDHKFQQQRAGARADYVYSQFFLERFTKLLWGSSWYLKTNLQLSSTKLLPSEEMSIAGFQYVRGYYENEIIGDQGYLIKNELRLPAYNIKKQNKKFLGEIQFLGFFDYGKVWDADPNIENRQSSALMSAGPGVRYNLHNHITARVDWGFRFKKPHTNSDKHRSMFHVSVVASY